MCLEIVALDMFERNGHVSRPGRCSPGTDHGGGVPNDAEPEMRATAPGATSATSYTHRIHVWYLC